MQFVTVLRLPVARERLFAFHADPRNLAVLLEGWRPTRVIVTDGHIRPGARTEVLERFGPLDLRIVFEHFLLDPPDRFGERQVRGPFARFEHVHVFRDPRDANGVELEDRVDVELPARLGGDLGVRLFVLPRLRRFFEFRRRAYERLAAQGRFGPLVARPRAAGGEPPSLRDDPRAADVPT